MDSLYTNEVTDFLKPAGNSLVLIHQHLENNANPCEYLITLLIKAYLHNYEKWPKYLVDRSNFVSLLF